MVVLTGVSSENLNFSLFTSEPGVYIAEIGQALVATSEWRLVIFYNLSGYWNEWSHLKQTHDYFQRWCETNSSQAVIHCKELLQPVSLVLQSIENNNGFFDTQSTRRRRAPLDFLGNVFSDLFGVLGPRDAREYNQQIEELSSGVLKMQNLIKQQVHVVDLTKEILQKHHIRIEKQYKMLYEGLQSVTIHEDYLDSVFQLSAAALMYKDIQEDLIDVLSDAHQGRPSLRLLPQTLLKKQLWEISQQIPRGMQIPHSNTHWLSIYKILTTKAAIVRNQIIFEVQIPLIQGEESQIFNIVPMPTKLKDRFIYLEPQFEYVLVSKSRAWYYPLTTEELRTCKLWEEGSRICSIKGPWYKVSSTEEHCEISLINHMKNPPNQCRVEAVLPTTFIHRLQYNRWLLVLPRETVFELICNQQVTSVTLRGSGIVTLVSGCSLRGSTVWITAVKQYNTSKYADLIPNFNLTQMINTKSLVLVSDTLDTDFMDLQQAMTDLKQEEPWTQVNIHHVGNYLTTGVLLTLVVLLMLGYKYKRSLNKKKPIRTREVEMQEIREVPRSRIRENLV